MPHHLSLTVSTSDGQHHAVTDYAAAMVLALVAKAEQINADASGELQIHYGRRHGVRLYRRAELMRVAICVGPNGRTE